MEGELASVHGAARHGVPFVLSSNATVSMEEAMAMAGARCWFQLYVQGDRSFTRDSIARVEATGCESCLRERRYAGARSAAPSIPGWIQYSVRCFPAPTPPA